MVLVHAGGEVREYCFKILRKFYLCHPIVVAPSALAKPLKGIRELCEDPNVMAHRARRELGAIFPFVVCLSPEAENFAHFVLAFHTQALTYFFQLVRGQLLDLLSYPGLDEASGFAWEQDFPALVAVLNPDPREQQRL